MNELNINYRSPANDKLLLSDYQNNKFLNNTLYILILTGIILTVTQYFYNRNLWLDEAMLSLNLLSRNYAQLLQPMDLNQVAPIGYLFVEKFFINILGNSEYALRLFPLLCYFLSLYLFYRFAYKISNNKLLAISSTALLSINYHMLYYASEVKQYGLDTTCTLISLNLLIGKDHNSKNRQIMAALIGMIIIWFSNVSVILLTVLAGYILFRTLKNKLKLSALLPMFFWAVSFIIYYLLFIKDHPNTDSMQNYWQKAFLPVNPFSLNFWVFLNDVFIDMIARRMLLFGPLKYGAVIVMLTAIICLIKERKYEMLYILTTPLIVHLLISAFRMYPVELRFQLYNLPLIILFFTYGFLKLFEVFKKWFSALIRPEILSLLLMCFIIPTLIQFPIIKEDIKPGMKFLKENLEENEKIIMNSGTYPAFSYYNRILEIENEVFVLKNKGKKFDVMEQFEREDNNLWLIQSHRSRTRKMGPKIMLELFNRGFRIQRKQEFHRTEIYLFYPVEGQNLVENKNQMKGK